MRLTERVAADLVAAMKERAELRLSVLRMLKAEFQKAQADKGRASELTDDDAQVLVRRLIKQRREAAEQYRAAGASERADGELAEAEVLEVYLPIQLGDTEIDALVAEAAKEAGAAAIRIAAWGHGGVSRQPTSVRELCWSLSFFIKAPMLIFRAAVYGSTAWPALLFLSSF